MYIACWLWLQGMKVEKVYVLFIILLTMYLTVILYVKDYHVNINQKNMMK